LVCGPSATITRLKGPVSTDLQAPEFGRMPTGMDHAMFCMMIIDDLIPAIQALWPAGEWNDPNFKIIVQQDGAGAHPDSWKDPPVICSTMAELEQNGNFTPGKISFEAQPPNSPDTNICDFGLFNAVQSSYTTSILQRITLRLLKWYRKPTMNIPAPRLTGSLSLSCQSTTASLSIMEDNFYKIPQMNKYKMEREGTLPRELPISADAVRILETYNTEEQLVGLP
jgi:hypothetical protein